LRSFFRAAEKQRFGMGVFFSKYELRKISIKENQFQDRDKSQLKGRKES
jgi:hypothetical protein